jgi:hypothetical protein
MIGTCAIVLVDQRAHRSEDSVLLGAPHRSPRGQPQVDIAPRAGRPPTEVFSGLPDRPRWIVSQRVDALRSEAEA